MKKGLRRLLRALAQGYRRRMKALPDEEGIETRPRGPKTHPWAGMKALPDEEGIETFQFLLYPYQKLV